MSKGKKKDGEDLADEVRGVFADLPYAEESPAVQQRPPSVSDSAVAGPARDAGAEVTTAGYQGNDRRVGDPDPDDDAPSVLSDEALAEAALIVKNDLVALERERDEYLDGLRRVQAEFENYRKRVIQQQSEHAERATEALVTELLPVLDACDAALQHGADDVAPVHAQLLDTLTKQGLERLDPAGEAFDPNFHAAVMHEESDDDGAGAVVAEVLRTGYSWKGRVLRPAMVKVKG